MYCPRCGQQQATDSMRFCSRCGFAMEGTIQLLAHGGMLPLFQAQPGEKTISPRRRGVTQGALLMLLGVLLVPILGVFSSFASGRLSNMFEFFTVIAALLCFLGGPLRMLFAAIFEEGAPPTHFTPPMSYKVPSAMPPAHVSALPPPAVNAASQWRPRPNTGELQPPASVTDSTTQLLDREPKRD
jgi:hypothetical protein